MIPEPITREEKFLKEIYDAAGHVTAKDPLIVTLTPDSEDPTTLTSEFNIGEIFDWIANGDKVEVEFPVPTSSEGWEYRGELAIHGTNGTYYFLGLQLVDPLNDTLDVLYALGQYEDITWHMKAYPQST